MPTMSSSRSIIRRKINTHGSRLSSGSESLNGIILKSQSNQDVPRTEFTLLCSHNATVNDGQMLVDADSRKFIPLQIDRPNLHDDSVYTRGYLRLVNASGSFSRYHNQPSASRDTWGNASGVEGTDYGWVVQKSRMWVSIEMLGLKAPLEPIGQMEKAVCNLFVPWSVNSSIVPRTEDRFTEKGGEKWRVEDVDPFTYKDQAFHCRITRDER